MVEFAVPLNVNVAPALLVKEPALLKLPATLRLAALFMIRDPEEAMAKLPQTSPAAFTVMVNPAGILTLSEDVGTVPKDQFDAVSQAPDDLALLIAINKVEVNSIDSVSIPVLWQLFFNMTCRVLKSPDDNYDRRPYWCRAFG